MFFGVVEVAVLGNETNDSVGGVFARKNDDFGKDDVFLFHFYMKELFVSFCNVDGLGFVADITKRKFLDWSRGGDSEFSGDIGGCSDVVVVCNNVYKGKGNVGSGIGYYSLNGLTIDY